MTAFNIFYTLKRNFYKAIILLVLYGRIFREYGAEEETRI